MLTHHRKPKKTVTNMSDPFPKDTNPDGFSHPRLKTEFKTIVAMVNIYCRAHHNGSDERDPCSSCQELISYARKRLLSCPFQGNKPTCGKCKVHCYKKSMQDRVKRVMRFAGPKMVYHHPIMALTHLLDSKRKTPTLN